jgi:glutamate synthase domain-containing protein 2
MLQRKHALRRNYPVIGHGRYLLESFRPEIQQYFVETNTGGRPFSRVFRSIVYQRAKGALQTSPFGTQQDVQRVGYEWMNHSLNPLHEPSVEPRVRIGGPDCTQPYDASHLNISAMSYGSLSPNAILALSRGAKLGGFAHNTGEGGLSPYHLAGGADLVWQIGTGYFGCRTPDGQFDPDQFGDNSRTPNVKMVELKLSQGAKPAHGGILPAKKVSREIATIRGVRIGEDVLSPPSHSTFSTPTGLLEFVAQLRELSGGKPIGFKLCIGRHHEFLAICKAMIATGVTPDFIAVDGGEGGTGAAPLEFSNSVGSPLREGLLFVHNALAGSDLRDRVKVIASGKVITGFHMIRAMALGADMCNAARGMMFALGCIQARRCNDNSCPVGVATTNKRLAHALDVTDKSERVARFHRETISALLALLAAAGVAGPEQLRPEHVNRRIAFNESHHFGELYNYLSPGSLLDGSAPGRYLEEWARADADSF